jgi:hypothetical protein
LFHRQLLPQCLEKSPMRETKRRDAYDNQDNGKFLRGRVNRKQQTAHCRKGSPLQNASCLISSRKELPDFQF